MNGWEIRRFAGCEVFFALAPADGSLIEIPHIKSPVDRCAVAAGCSAQPATTSRHKWRRRKKMYYSCTNEAKKLEANPRKLLHYSNLNRIFCLIEARCALSLGALIGDRKLRRTPRYGTDENYLYLQFSRTGSHLPLLRPQPWL